MSTSNLAIQIKNSGQTGNTPSDLVHGEIAINYADGKIYYKNDLNVIENITNQDSFSTINANGTLVLATSPTDILNIIPGNNTIIVANSVSKSITIESIATGGGSGGFPVVDLGYVYQALEDFVDCGTL